MLYDRQYKKVEHVTTKTQNAERYRVGVLNFLSKFSLTLVCFCSCLKIMLNCYHSKTACYNQSIL